MKYKKKIIIVNNNLATGGVQKALVNLLNEIKDKYDVTLFVFSNSGEYKKSIPQRIKVIEANPLLELLGISQDQSKEKGFLLYFIRAVLVLWTKQFNSFLPIRGLIITEKKLSGFDIAISYLHSSGDKSFYGGCNEFVQHRIDANQKIAFIHCDYSNYGGNTKKNNNMYKKFDKIAAVSRGCLNSFIKVLPELSAKTVCINNCHNYTDIKKRGEESPVVYNSNYFNIVTVARLGPEKGVTRAINVIADIVKKNYRICWHIIGEGSIRKEIERLIFIHSLEENIILYGNQDNPYRYMENADLFFLPSYHEAAPMVFSEAKLLGLPILTTNTTSAEEFITDDMVGWVCENSSEGIREKLEYILNSLGELEGIRENIKYLKFDNKLALKQFESVIEEEAFYD